MASSYSDILRFEKQANGENSTTWGTKLNTVFELVEDSVAGLATVAVTGGTDVLTTNNSATDEARMAILKITGTLTSNQIIQAPAFSKHYYIGNATSGNFTVTIKVSGGVGVIIPQGSKLEAFTDGTDFFLLSYDSQAAGTDVASASTIDLTAEAAKVFVITGTTTTVAVTMNTGQLAICIADGAWPLTYHATTNKINTGGTDQTLSAGDRVYYYKDNDGVIHGDIVLASGATLRGGAHENDFRLTLASNTPVTTTDQTAKTTVYCTPYKGDRIDIYNGSAWVLFTSTQMSVTVPSTTSTPFDVFIYDNAGTPTLELLNWSNTTTRATALAYQNGILCKTGALTRHYLGTGTTSTVTSQIEDTAVFRGLWNYYHRKERRGYNIFGADRTNTGTGLDEINSEIRINFIIGVEEDSIIAMFNGSSRSNTLYVISGIAISLDGGTPEIGYSYNGTSDLIINDEFGVCMPIAGYAVGLHYITGFSSHTSGTTTFRSAVCALAMIMKG